MTTTTAPPPDEAPAAPNGARRREFDPNTLALLKGVQRFVREEVDRAKAQVEAELAVLRASMCPASKDLGGARADDAVQRRAETRKLPYNPNGLAGTLHRQQQIRQRALAAVARTAPIARRAATHTPQKSRGPSAMVLRAADAYAVELLRRNAERSPRGPHWRLALLKQAKGAAVLLGVAESARGDALVLLVDCTGTLRDADSMRAMTLDQVEHRMQT